MNSVKLADTAVQPRPSAEFDIPPTDPIALFHDWLEQATDRGAQEPTVMALATAGRHGHASNRMVRVLGVTPEGLVFTTHVRSQKGCELSVTAWASGVLYWRETKQQVIFTGPVKQLSSARSDALWAHRPVSVQAMSAASRQGAPLDDEERLRSYAKQLASGGQPLPRPAGWSGYLLAPSSAEFWQGSPDGLHRRLRYDRFAGTWTSYRLQP